MRPTTIKANATKTALLDAAKKVLVSRGYSGLSTRAIADTANTQMSQIRYHFGSKEGLVLALYEYMTEQLIERQSNVFADKTQPLSKKWDIACDYLDADIESGYVRVFQELLAQGWSNPRIAKVVVTTLRQWFGLHLTLAKEFQQTCGSFGPFEAEDIALLISPAFVGVESFILLGWDEDSAPIRRALRRFGNVIQHFETIEKGEN
ncbi:MAG: TetR/AcrR family transcriptional regulator [Rhodobacteraceae bacterium]|nr:TetR/AcrR family transcriptional regulator [Paracoccaceae bacterium]